MRAIIFIMAFLLLACSRADGDNVSLECGGTTLSIPSAYVVKESRFFWIDTGKGLDSDRCSVRLIFNEGPSQNREGGSVRSSLLPTKKVVLTIVDSQNMDKVNKIEQDAMTKTGNFANSVFYPNSASGFLKAEEYAGSARTYLFDKKDDESFRYVGVCSEYADSEPHCVIVYRHENIQFEFSLNGNSIDRNLYRNLTKSMASEASDWIVH